MTARVMASGSAVAPDALGVPLHKGSVAAAGAGFGPFPGAPAAGPATDEVSAKLDRGEFAPNTTSELRDAPGRRLLNLSLLPTGGVLFALDAAFVAILWPLLLWNAHAGVLPRLALPMDVRAILYPACDLLLLYAMGLYRRDALLHTGMSLSRVPLVVGMGAALTLLFSITLGALDPALFLQPDGRDQMFELAFASLCFTATAYHARMLVKVMVRRQMLRRRLLVVGAGRRAWDLLHMLSKEGGNLSYDIAFLHHDVLGQTDSRLTDAPGARVLRPATFAVLQAARKLGADQIVIAPDERRGMDLEELLACKTAGFPVVQYLSFVEQEIRRIDLKRMELGWLLFSDGFQFSAIDRFLKRVFDIVISSSLLVATAPVTVAAMMAIRWEGAGPVLYRQERVTQGGRVFRILKLRTMRTDSEAGGAVWAAQQDSRITKIGGFLRRTRIDELPQLVNVLCGEMSFVGPRPERPVFTVELARQIPLYNERHMVKAGLTGWAQVNYPYGASVDDARSKLSYDLYYVKNFSILFDLVILLQTLRVVLWPSGVR
ncbi:MAG TPA: TIGR03013 family XrtA/PEP-CTERM system glycosyltransferase [Acetobacteraceae bacterium]|nr:TIGR03013 family XrtA/PEP-CTERM system glycosyltransferase [Acetobacteraceae bacterium]